MTAIATEPGIVTYNGEPIGTIKEPVEIVIEVNWLIGPLSTLQAASPR